MRNFKVTCGKCKKTSEVKIYENESNLYPFHRVEYLEDGNIISARFRFDDQWGFECKCGENNILSETEKRYWKHTVVAPKPQEMKSIVDNLKPEKQKFSLETV